MKKGLTELVFIIDKSGSMHELKMDTIGGYNSMLEKQKKEEGDAFVTTILFDTEYTVFQDHVKLDEAKTMTDDDYYTGGMTALMDAVGSTIDNIGKRLADTAEEERPETVIFVIITDGYENASKEYSKDAVRSKIEHQQSKYSWQFIYLGADIDAAAEASKIGISAKFARNYTKSSKGLESAYMGMSTVMSVARKRTTYKSETEYESAVCDSLDKIE